jgi:hypothetical protein
MTKSSMAVSEIVAALSPLNFRTPNSNVLFPVVFENEASTPLHERAARKEIAFQGRIASQ